MIGDFMNFRELKRNFIGVSRVFFQLIKEDYEEMDHKFIKIITGIIYIAISALLWYLFFSKMF